MKGTSTIFFYLKICLLIYVFNISVKNTKLEINRIFY